MPEVGARAEDEEEEQVFQSPEWEPSAAVPDQGASPQLRRSTRKRKSTAGDSANNGTSSKKKKASPGKMPKTARSPPKPQADRTSPSKSFEALLLAMEGRLTAKMEKASEAAKDAALQAKLNSESLEQLESRVDANEQCLMKALEDTEARIMAKVQDQLQDMVQGKVQDMVSAQLQAAGFDQDLTASDMSVRESAAKTSQPTASTSYAAIASLRKPAMTMVSRLNKQEEGFHLARRQLRLWPIKEGRKECLEAFLTEKLRMNGDFVREELGSVEISKVKEPRNKNKDEYVITFESKQIRDEVKAAAPNLANHRDSAGMRLQVPAHLQPDFHALMNLSFDLKKRHPGLKRNIKFDEVDLGLFMDLKLNDEAEWRRIKPDRARAANKRRSKRRSMEQDEIQELLESETDDE